mmetsp:Transcript_10290/g.16372  ORF Transcript_10290/g.16372 Transcript_10290/m.16372 type:complete len:512 (+) Transcript_10290:76-1611(+)
MELSAFKAFSELRSQTLYHPNQVGSRNSRQTKEETHATSWRDRLTSGPRRDSLSSVDGTNVGLPECRRWHILLILVAHQMANSMLWISFAPIAIEISIFYNVHVQFVNTLSTVCLLLFPVGMVWCSFITTKCGLRQVMVVAAALHLVSGFLRWASYPLVGWIGGRTAYAMLLLGQIFSAFAQPICTNLPVRLANEWFPSSERDTATTLGNVGFGIGNIVGMALPGILVHMKDGNKEARNVHGMGTLLLIECVICLFGFVWCWLFFVDEPFLPPSRSAALKRSTRMDKTLSDGSSVTSRVFNDYKHLVQDNSFCILLYCFSVGLGAFNCLFTVFEQFMKPAGYTNSHTSQFANIIFAAGFVTAALLGKIMDATKAYVPALRWCFCGTFMTVCVFVLQIRPSNYTGISIACACMGAACIPILPLSLETAAEITYPLPEEASTGMLILGGNYLSIMLSYVSAALIQPKYTGVINIASVFTMVVVSTSAIGIFFFKGVFKRQHADVSIEKTIELT